MHSQARRILYVLSTVFALAIGLIFGVSFPEVFNAVLIPLIVKPMSVEEAILQMNLLGHTFFVFKNQETDEMNVVYKRKDGKYAVIESIE